LKRKHILALSIVLPLCLAASDANPKDAARGDIVNGCWTSLSSSKASYQFDQPVLLTLVVHNEGAKEFTTGDLDFFPELKLEVTMPDGKPAPLTLEGKRRAESPAWEYMYETIAPKGSLTIAIGNDSFNRLYDMTLRGTYTVKVTIDVWEGANEKHPFKLVSNTIKIEIHEREIEATTKPAE
jgi:hypothetical protein